MYSTLISAHQLNAELATAVVVDCRSDLMNPEAGRTAYLAGHISGAVHANLETDLSGPKTPMTGRHPLPDPLQLAKTLGGWGIANDSQVIAYDADNGMYASRLWWLLRWLGHRSVAVLDGGLKGWLAAGFPTSQDTPSPRRTAFVPHVDSSAVVTAAEVATLACHNDWRVLDARAPERFRGEVEPIDPVAGHIPGARNYPFATNLSADGRMLGAPVLAEQLRTALDSVPAERSVMMCGSGVTACHNLLALEIAGMRGAKLYAGSWSEWIRDPSRPVEKGSGNRG